VIKPVLYQLDRNDQAIQQLPEPLVRADIGPEPVTAEQYVSAEQRVSFAFEQQSLGQRHHFISMVAKPLLKVLLFPAPFFEPEIARNEFRPNHQTSIGGEDHVRETGLGLHQLNVAAE